MVRRLSQKFAEQRFKECLPSGEMRMIHYWDGTLPGFGLRINPGWSAFWVARYRTGVGKTGIMSLGRIAELNYTDAKKLAADVIHRARMGENPKHELDSRRNAHTFAEAWARYKIEHLTQKKPLTQIAYERLVETHALPRLKSKKVIDITTADIQKLHSDISARTPVEANRAMAVVSGILNYCEVWTWRPTGSNPCQHLRRSKEKKRTRFLSEPEFKRLVEVCEREIAAASSLSRAAQIVLLMLYTGARPSEIVHAKWSNLDRERGVLVLQDSKTGAGEIGFPVQAFAITDRISAKLNNPYIFPGRCAGHWTQVFPDWKQIRILAQVEDVHLHDLRHTFATYAHGGGLSMRDVSKLLRHTSIEMTDRYVHSLKNDLRAQSQSVADRIAQTIGQKNLTPPSESETIEARENKPFPREE